MGLLRSAFFVQFSKQFLKMKKRYVVINHRLSKLKKIIMSYSYLFKKSTIILDVKHI